MLFDPAKQQSLKNKLAQRKEKNLANRQLMKFKNMVKSKKHGNTVQLEHEKMEMLPATLEEDSDLALLYLYFCARYKDE